MARRYWRFWWAVPLGFLYETAVRWAGRAVAAGATGHTGLDESTKAFVGKQLQVTPFHGYGWTSHQDLVRPPEPFRARLVRLWSHDGERRGGVARVEEAGHDLDQLWVVFSTRHAAPYNFQNRIGAYNVDLSSEKPVSNASGWPVMPIAATNLSGWAEIRGVVQ